MKKFYYTFIIIFISNLGFSQEDVWSRLFLERLAVSEAVPKSIAYTNDFNIIYPVVEDGNVLKIYQLNGGGDIVRILDTGESATSISEIVKISETEFTLIFNVETIGLTSVYKVIYFNDLLQVTSEAILILPITSNFVDLIRFFKVENQLLVSFNDNGTYYLMRLNFNNELQIVYTSTNNVTTDQISILSTGNLLIDFSTGQGHTLKFINPVSGDLLWERNYGSPNDINLDYLKTFDNDDNIYMVRLIRNFVNGDIFDSIELLKIRASDGSIILNIIENPANNCVLKFEDLKYNEITQELYFSYSTCSDPSSIVLKSFSSSLQPLHTLDIVASPDGFFSSVVKSAQILFRSDGRIVFVYRDFKNVEEFDNIYLLSLTKDLFPIYTGELNIPQKNGNELFVDIQLFDSTKALMIGYVPHKDPNISWEEIQFFISMIDLDAVLNIQDLISTNIVLYPNPSTNNLSIISAEIFVDFQVYDVSGKIINCPKNLLHKTIDISDLKSGVYSLRMKTSSSNTISKQFIKF